MTKTVEYRVRPVIRYHVTRFESEINENGICSSGCESLGEFDSGEVAYQVGYALCRKEHTDSGEPIGSENFKYPSIPDGASISPSPFSDKER